MSFLEWVLDEVSGLEAFMFAGFIVFWVAAIFLRFAYRSRVVPVRDLQTIGECNDLEVRVVVAPGGRRYVSLSHWTPVQDNVRREFQAVFPSAQALQLARMLRIAETAGRTLAIARWAYHRDARSRTTASRST